MVALPVALAYRAARTIARGVAGGRIVAVARSALDFIMFSGLLATPPVSIGGFVGLILPEAHPLHRCAPTLIAGAAIWFFLAVVYAHAWRENTRRARSHT
jgi:hypothetical protein